MLNHFKINGIIGVSDLGNGSYRLDFQDLSRLATPDEISAAQAEIIIEQINAKRAEKEFLPIGYDGKLLDADADAIKNINGQILRLESKIALGQTIDTTTLFWRDAENNTHAWTDVAEYLNWLRGLAIAIAERTSYLYYIAWQKKLDPLNADIEQGW